MQSIIIYRVATTAVMPLVAASGFAGYSYYDQNQYQNQYGAPVTMACTVLTVSGYDGVLTRTDMLSLQRFFLARGYLRGSPTGVMDQATFTAIQRFQADNGLPITGTVDAITRSSIEQISCGTTGYPSSGNPPYQNTNGQLSVTGIDAPRSLSIGQTGTWSVHVSGYTKYQGGGALHYSVVWGDEQYGTRSATAYYPSTSVSSSGTFTHVYTRAGTFTPVFTVTDTYGHTTQTSATTHVAVTAGYGNGTTYGNSCSGTSGYYDRNCYATGYTGSTYPYQGTTNYGDQYYNRSSGGSTTYTNPYGGPNGVDYSCYYDRACYNSTYGSGTYGTGGSYSDPYARTGYDPYGNNYGVANNSGSQYYNRGY